MAFLLALLSVLLQVNGETFVSTQTGFPFQIEPVSVFLVKHMFVFGI